MNIPKWSIIASAAIAVIAVLMIVMPGEKKQDEEEITPVAVQSTENTAENRETSAGKENTEKETTEKETAPAAIVIDTDQVSEETEGPEETGELKETVSEGISDDAAEIAKKLSTDEHANATDFEWFMDMELFDGTEAGAIVTEPGRTEKITGSDNAFLNGGWKAYQLDTIKKPYNPETVRYYNAEIDTEGEKFNITMNWAYMFMPEAGQSVEESGNDLFEGTWDPETGTATAQSKWAKVDFDNFYIAADRSAEYATGTFYWISGETERIALMRVENK